MSVESPYWDYIISNRSTELFLNLVRGKPVIEGLENVPKKGPLIVGVNHVSILDPMLTAVALYRVRFPYFMGKEELFRIPILGKLFYRIGAIPLDRGRGDVSAIRRALTVLNENGCMVLFPEGTRSKTGRPGRPKSGIGLLARESGAPVLPARVFNTSPIWGDEPTRIRFGLPMKHPGETTRLADKHFAEAIMDEVFKL